MSNYTKFGYSEQLLSGWGGSIWIYDSQHKYACFQTATQDTILQLEVEVRNRDEILRTSRSLSLAIKLPLVWKANWSTLFQVPPI